MTYGLSAFTMFTGLISASLINAGNSAGNSADNSAIVMASRLQRASEDACTTADDSLSTMWSAYPLKPILYTCISSIEKMLIRFIDLFYIIAPQGCPTLDLTSFEFRFFGHLE